MFQIIRNYKKKGSFKISNNFACLPLPDVIGSVEEADYALGDLKLNGIGLLSNVNGNYPGRFKAFAAVPFPYIDESVSEIKYALDTLKLGGVSFSPITKEVQLDNESGLPVLAELNKRRTAVFLHPINSEGIPVSLRKH